MRRFLNSNSFTFYSQKVHRHMLSQSFIYMLKAGFRFYSLFAQRGRKVNYSLFYIEVIKIKHTHTQINSSVNSGKVLFYSICLS